LIIAAILGDDGDARQNLNHDAAIQGRQLVSVNSTGLASVSILRYRRAMPVIRAVLTYRSGAHATRLGPSFQGNKNAPRGEARAEQKRA
jgi:hypothetical protein